MTWLRRLIKRLVGPDKYHQQASEVTARALRAELLSKRLDVMTRRHR